MPLIAFVGNPNVGKSTLFNALTGLKQHTGNWSGKTVELAQGSCTYKGGSYTLVDLPGTYSMQGASPEEKISAEFLKEQKIDCAVVVCDATCLERSLILALQVMSFCPKTLVCINLIDEARRMGKRIDAHALQAMLGVSVVLTSADSGEGIDRLMEAAREVCDGFAPSQTITADSSEALVYRAEEIVRSCVENDGEKCSITQRLDAVFLHRKFGLLAMFVLLFGIFWITIEGANYPSQGLQWCFDRLRIALLRATNPLPKFVQGILVDGMYATASRVVAVMLPPMAIFFPMFTILEDLGYLPRVAYLLDGGFRRVGACGKQSLTMCMGFGCNAVGVSGCRIIASEQERKIAIVTNAFVPCNGRFPGLIFLIGMSFSMGSAWLSAGVLTACIAVSVGMSLLASLCLHKTCFRGEKSSFVLELPPYRKAKILRVIVRSLLDRTVKILGRAVAVALPMGAVIWLLGNAEISGITLLKRLAEVLDAPAKCFGLNGAILLAFILGSPANELVLPILVMILTSSKTLPNDAMAEILRMHGWSWQLSLCTMVFFLFHWPCTTTLWTIRKETRSTKLALLAAILPTVFGSALCFLLRVLLAPHF